MNKKEYIKSQKECASMLGLEKIELLYKLGLSEKDLKKKER